MPKHLRLISHKLCPFVQRAVIVATEKGISFERVDIDLADKPDWFLAISPTGKVPVLEVTGDNGETQVLFESAVIAEYLDEISENPLLPAEPLARARQRAWVEFASATLADVGKLYSATDEPAFTEALRAVEARVSQLDRELAGPWFAGDSFGLVDAAFAPVFRYLDVFDWRVGTELVARSPNIRTWSQALAARPSVRAAVAGDYAERLIDFVAAKKSFLGRILEKHALEAA
ncbi:MAG TPA: glutathione S-transferase family protein [Sphingomicrobium sp.]|nr:glutathione S-transferase family protein [Sphingomicrobium sp.]